MPLQLVTRFIKNNLLMFVVALLGGIVGSITTIIISLSLGNYYRIFFHHDGSKTNLLNLIGFNTLGTINSFFAFYAVLLLVKVTSDWIFHYFSKTAAGKLVTELRVTLFRNEIYGLNHKHFHTGTGKKVVKYGNDMQSIQNLYTKGILTFIKDLFLLAIGFALLIKINATLSWIMLGSFPVLIGINYLFSRQLQVHTLSKRHAQSDLINFVNNSFQAIDTIKLFRKEKVEVKRFTRHSERLYLSHKRYYYYFAYIQAFVPVLLYTITGVILFMVASQKIDVKDTDLMAFVLISILQFSALRRVVKVETIWRAGLISLKKINEHAPSNEIQNTQSSNIGRFNALHFENFKIDNGGKQEFEINCLVKAGTINYISCPSPEKFIDVLTGNAHHFSGRISVNKKPINQIHQTDLYKLFSLASNQFPLVGRGIYEMVSTGKKPGMKFKTIEVLRNLGWDLIEPKVDLEKNITSQNIELNRNHRHLLFIARAVLCNGQVLLLNKPFHGLNENIAKKCFNYLESLTPNKTIIIISETQTLPFLRPELNENLERQVG